MTRGASLVPGAPTPGMHSSQASDAEQSRHDDHRTRGLGQPCRALAYDVVLRRTP
ncbi:hypothetical protein [Streptomyces sp. NPDC046985]|uniref:hypothetical protein n=1 Tax=Streptomyces sp. NPDC046985 TaxID=3155377 RepID=UPI003408273F